MPASLMLSACGGDDDELQVGSLRLIGQQVLPRRTEFQGTGSDYPKVPEAGVADPESVRVDPGNGNLVWASEGVQATPVPDNAFTVSGATEILAVTEKHFLVLERSFSVGVAGNQVRLHEIVDISAATDVLVQPSLVGSTAKPVSKRLVLDFETLKAQLSGIANREGMTCGPRLTNGNPSLVVVADDNFPTADSATDCNQILVFEVLR